MLQRDTGIRRRRRGRSEFRVHARAKLMINGHANKPETANDKEKRIKQIQLKTISTANFLDAVSLLSIPLAAAEAR